MTKEKIKDAIYTRRYIYNFHYYLIWVTSIAIRLLQPRSYLTK